MQNTLKPNKDGRYGPYKQADGVCQWDTVTPAPAGTPPGPCMRVTPPSTGDPELDELLRIMNSNFDNGIQEFTDQLFSTCNLHALEIMCANGRQNSTADVFPQNSTDFCRSHCFRWTKMVLSHCLPGEIQPDIEQLLRDRIKCSPNGNPPVHALSCSTSAELSALVKRIDEACCTAAYPCQGGAPTKCSARCGSILVPFQAACSSGILEGSASAGTRSLIDAAAALCAASGGGSL
jgi:hypothetical protein